MAVASLSVTRLAPPRVGVVLGLLMAASGFLLVERAWTEPLLMGGVAAAVWAAVRGRSRWMVLAMALVFGTKQHMVLLLPLTVAWRSMGPPADPDRLRDRGTAGIAVVPCRTRRLHRRHAPVPRHPGAAQLSLSIYVLATRGGFADVLQPLAPLLIIIPTALAEALAVWRLPRTTLGFTLGAALVLFTFAIVNKQSFYNHYALVLAFILLAIALLLRGDDEVDVTATPPPAT